MQMSVSKSAFLLIAIFCCLCISKVHLKPNSYYINAAKHYCGQKLPEILQFICNENTFSPLNYNDEMEMEKEGVEEIEEEDEEERKRSDFNSNFNFKSDSNFDSNVADANANSNSINNQYLKRNRVQRIFEANAIKSRRGQVRRFGRGGIVEECCEKPCTIEELSEYCASSSDSLDK